MTSPSRRNRPTTAWSTRRRTRSCSSRPLQIAAALILGGLISGATTGAEPSPLQRLQQRSGDARWEELRARALAAPDVAHDRAGDRDQDDLAPAAPEEAAPPAPEPEWQPVPEQASEADGSAAPRALDFEALPFGEDVSARRPLSTAGPRTKFAGPGAAFVQTETPNAPDSPQDLAPDSPLRKQPLGLRPITDIQPFFDYSPTGGDPCEHLCPAPAGVCPDDPNRLCPPLLEMPMSTTAERYFPHLEFYWAASDLYHNPLYFENPALERYGHVHFHDCLEPAYSMARFSAQLVGLPYQMALDSACRRQYALGWYRPGDFAPKLIYQPPLNARAAGTAAAVYTGLFFLVP